MPVISFEWYQPIGTNIFSILINHIMFFQCSRLLIIRNTDEKVYKYSVFVVISTILGHIQPRQMEPSKVQEIKNIFQDNQYPDCSSKERYYIKRRCENFTLKGKGVLSWSHHIQVIQLLLLFNISFNIRWRAALHMQKKKEKSQHLAIVVLSPKEAQNIFVELHAGPLGGQCGVEKTHNAIILRFYWPGIEQDICKWVS